MAGYSGRALVDKLGVRTGDRLGVIGAPEGFDATLGSLPAGTTIRRQLRGPLDLVVSFHTDRADLARRLPALTGATVVDGALWIAWPKKASGVATDITEDVVRAVALPTGLVDTKVCAIDDTWSGLRLVLRKELRAGRDRQGPVVVRSA